MAIVNKVDKKVRTGKDQVIKYQILTYCFLNDIKISLSDLNCLLYLAKFESIELTEFCKLISDSGIFKSSQSCRNALSKAEKKGLLVKEGKNKKGGLNEAGRKSYEKENPGSNLKAPTKSKTSKRRKAFCLRMLGMKKKLTSKKVARDPNSRINKALRKWDC